jgi:hypothetical protein
MGQFSIYVGHQTHVLIETASSASNFDGLHAVTIPSSAT